MDELSDNRASCLEKKYEVSTKFNSKMMASLSDLIQGRGVAVEDITVNLEEQVAVDLDESQLETNENNEGENIHESNIDDRGPIDVEIERSEDLTDNFESETNKGNAKEVYTCDKCKRIFSSLSWFKKHADKCELLYQCDSCPKILKNVKGLKEHRIKCHGKTFPCEICDKTFKTVKKLQSHQKKAHEAEKICPQCMVKCKNIRALRKHQKKTCKGNQSISTVPGSVTNTSDHSDNGENSASVIIASGSGGTGDNETSKKVLIL